jgi:hypothetical protein
MAAGAAATGAALSVGLHVGRVLASRVAAGGEPTITAVGDTLATAEALRRRAVPGVILLSGAAAAALGEQIEVRPLGVAEASGPASEADALELVRLRTPLPRRSVLALERQRTLTPFVGRQTELAVLEQSWERARDRRGQVVGIVGEPGVGKSRLLREACLRLAEAGALVVTGECASYAQATPYLPIASLVRQLAQVAEDDDRERQVQRVATLLDTLALDGAAHAAPLVDALG